MTNLKGKTIDGITIIAHKLPATSKPVQKEQLEMYEGTRRAAQELGRFRALSATDGNLANALTNIENMLRTTRRMFNEEKKGGTQQLTYKYKLPLNASLEVFKSGSRKLSDYDQDFSDNVVIEGEASASAIVKTIKDRRSREIRKARNASRKPRTPNRNFSVNLGMPGNRQSYQFKLQAGCHTVPGEIMKFKNAKGKPGVQEDKRPSTEEHHVGIELEFVSKLNAGSLGLALLVEGLGEWCQLKGDGSVRDESASNYFPHEICICVPESKMEDVVERVCKVLNDAGSKVNKTCGMHVHLDMRKRDRNVTFANLVSSQGILYGMQPSDRRDNKFCKKTESKKFDIAAREAGGDRYRGINPAALERHNTIEIRMHSGTTNARKIKNWVNLLVSIVSAKKVVTEEPKSADSITKLFNLAPLVSSYVKERMEKFKKKEVGIENEDNGEAA